MPPFYTVFAHKCSPVQPAWLYFSISCHSNTPPQTLDFQFIFAALGKVQYTFICIYLCPSLSSVSLLPSWTSSLRCYIHRRLACQFKHNAPHGVLVPENHHFASKIISFDSPELRNSNGATFVSMYLRFRRIKVFILYITLGSLYLVFCAQLIVCYWGFLI